MTVTPRAWAHGFDQLTGPIILQKGGAFYAQLRRPQGVERAILVSGFLMDSIEAAVGASGLQALLNSAASGGRMIRGGTFAENVAAAVRNARGVLTVALLNLDGKGRGKEVLRAQDVATAAVLLLAAEPGLQSMGREWFGEAKNGVRQLGRLNLPGIGAALLSAHISGPVFADDALPVIAGALLMEAA